jgi:hypothetical protein
MPFQIDTKIFELKALRLLGYIANGVKSTGQQ